MEWFFRFGGQHHDLGPGEHQRAIRRFRNFSFYPSITSTGLIRAYKTDKQREEKKEKEKRARSANWRRYYVYDIKKLGENWRKHLTKVLKRPEMVF